MELLWILLIGLVIGAIAKLLMPGPDPGGIFITMLLGIAGALVATLLGQLFGLYEVGDSAGFIASVIGAILILAGFRWVRRHS